MVSFKNITANIAATAGLRKKTIDPLLALNIFKASINVIYAKPDKIKPKYIILKNPSLGKYKTGSFINSNIGIVHILPIMAERLIMVILLILSAFFFPNTVYNPKVNEDMTPNNKLNGVSPVESGLYIINIIPISPSNIHIMLFLYTFSLSNKTENITTKIGLELINMAAVEAFPMDIANWRLPMLITVFNMPKPAKNSQSFFDMASLFTITHGKSTNPPNKNLIKMS